MAERASQFRAWVAVGAWVAVQLTATSLPGSVLPNVTFGLDDVAHVGMYAVLAFLVQRAARRGGMPARRIWILLPVIVAYGALDELHQTFIPGRDASLLDWLADGIGATAGLAAGVLIIKTTWAAWLE